VRVCAPACPLDVSSPASIAQSTQMLHTTCTLIWQARLWCAVVTYLAHLRLM